MCALANSFQRQTIKILTFFHLSDHTYIFADSEIIKIRVTQSKIGRRHRRMSPMPSCHCYLQKIPRPRSGNKLDTDKHKAFHRIDSAGRSFDQILHSFPGDNEILQSKRSDFPAHPVHVHSQCVIIDELFFIP